MSRKQNQKPFSKFDRKEKVKVKDNLNEILLREWKDLYIFKGLENIKNHLLSHSGQEVTIGSKRYLEEYKTWVYKIKGHEFYVWQDDFLEKM